MWRLSEKSTSWLKYLPRMWLNLGLFFNIVPFAAHTFLLLVLHCLNPIGKSVINCRFDVSRWTDLYYIWGLSEESTGWLKYLHGMWLNLGLFFNIVPFAAHTFLLLVLQCLNPIGKRVINSRFDVSLWTGLFIYEDCLKSPLADLNTFIECD